MWQNIMRLSQLEESSEKHFLLMCLSIIWKRESPLVYGRCGAFLQVGGLHRTDLLSLLCLASACPIGLSTVSSLEGIVLGMPPVALQLGDHSQCVVRQLHLSSF
ncbi:hypothetical protein ABBQ38_006043 [Trebouxia sp. C0009 RCD-2024]